MNICFFLFFCDIVLCDFSSLAVVSASKRSRLLYFSRMPGFMCIGGSRKFCLGVLTIYLFLIINKCHRGTYQPWVQVLFKGSIPVFLRTPIATCDFPQGIRTPYPSGFAHDVYVVYLSPIQCHG